MAKKLYLKFQIGDDATDTWEMGITSPKEGLTLAEVQNVANVFIKNKGVDKNLTALVGSYYKETITENIEA